MADQERLRFRKFFPRLDDSKWTDTGISVAITALDIASLHSKLPRLMQQDLLLAIVTHPFPEEPAQQILEGYQFGEIEAKKTIKAVFSSRTEVSPPDGEKTLREAATNARIDDVDVHPIHILEALNKSKNYKMQALLRRYVMERGDMDARINQAKAGIFKETKESKDSINTDSVMDVIDFVHETFTREGLPKEARVLIARRMTTLRNQLLDLSGVKFTPRSIRR